MASEIRRLGYFIPKAHGKLDTLILDRPMDERVIAEFEEVVEVASKLRPIMSAAHIVLRNLSELQLFVANTQKATSIEKLKLDIGSALEFKIDACRHILNSLSSFKALLDHCDAHLCECFGKDSQERARFRAETVRQYDTNYSYRFLSKLRNYAQHFSLPISHANVTVKMNYQESSFTTELRLQLDRDILLEWTRWGSLRVEVSTMPSAIDVLPMFREMDKSINQLCATVFAEHADELLRCQDYLERVSLILKLENGAIPVVWIGKGENGNPPGRTEVLPVDELRLIFLAMENAS